MRIKLFILLFLTLCACIAFAHQYLTAQKMFINQIIEAVMSETKTEPRYGTLELAGHVGCDFIFTR